MTHQQFAQVHKRGFTFIEVLVYVALFSLVLGGVLVTAYPLMTGAEKLSTRVTTDIEAAFVLRKISWALSATAGVTVPSADELDITRLGGGAISFRQGVLATDVIEMSEGGPFLPLTASRVNFSGLTFIKDPDPTVFNAPHVIQASFTANGISYSQTYNVFYP